MAPGLHEGPRMRLRRSLLLMAALLLALAIAGSLWLGVRPYEGGFEPAEPAELTPRALDEALHEVLLEAPELDEAEREPREEPGDLEAAPARWAARTVRHRTPALQALEGVLVVGLDRRKGRGWGRADTLLVVLVDRDSRHVGLVSVPRDTWVAIPKHGMARINATLLLAERLGLEPLETLREVMAELLGVSISHAVALDLGAFSRIVDAVGGITVEVPCAIVDDFVDPSAPSGRRLLDVPAGEVHMDGATAAMYARSRHGRSDWSRARRQQAIVFAVRRRLSGLAGLARWPAALAEVERSVRTDMSRGELLALAELGLKIEPAHLHGLILGHRVMRHRRTDQGQQVLVPDYEALDEALSTLFDAPAPGALPDHGRCRPREAALRAGP